jgi:2'-5' RNA ligase
MITSAAERCNWKRGDLVPIKVRTAGDKEGHEFHGNQWSNPMAGEPDGIHTKEAAHRMTACLERETGMKFKLMGSLGKGADSSPNDMDLAYIDPHAGMTDEQIEIYEQASMDEMHKAEDDVRDKISRGEISEHEGMSQLYGEAVDPLANAFEKIGFKPSRDMSWMGISVVRYTNPTTQHTVEIWAPSGDSGSAENGPPTMRGRDLGDKTGHDFYGNQWTAGGTKEDFIALGRAQRDKPETAMNDAVAVLGGGPLSYVLEHVGDLNHRMNDHNTFDSAGYAYVKSKVDSSLNIMNNASDFRSIVHTERNSKQVEALRNYAEAHRALPAYNEAHALARTATTALGDQKFFIARKALTELQAHLKSKDEWVAFARQNLKREPRTAALFDTSKSEHSGLLVSLHLDIATAKKLKVPGGENPEQMHITLCYCGDVEELGDINVARAIVAVNQVVQASAPLQGTTTELDRFDATEHSDGQDVIISRVDIPGLFEFRQQLADALTAVDVPPRSNFAEYKPHITLAYIPTGDEPPVDEIPQLPLTFTEVQITIGDQTTNIPFGQAPRNLRGWMRYLLGRIAGGVGSGIKGHTTEHDTTVYHGTHGDRLRSIIKEGIRFSHSGENFPGFSNRAHVYVTASLLEAQQWAVQVGPGNSAVVEVHVPASHAHLVIPDDNYTFTGKDGAKFVNTEQKMFKGDIPREWIAKAWTREDKAGKRRWSLTTLQAVDGVVLYVVIPLDDVVKTLGDVEGHQFHGNQWDDKRHAEPPVKAPTKYALWKARQEAKKQATSTEPKVEPPKAEPKIESKTEPKAESPKVEPKEPAFVALPKLSEVRTQTDAQLADRIRDDRLVNTMYGDSFNVTNPKAGPAFDGLTVDDRLRYIEMNANKRTGGDRISAEVPGEFLFHRYGFEMRKDVPPGLSGPELRAYFHEHPELLATAKTEHASQNTADLQVHGSDLLKGLSENQKQELLDKLPESLKRLDVKHAVDFDSAALVAAGFTQKQIEGYSDKLDAVAGIKGFRLHGDASSLYDSTVSTARLHVAEFSADREVALHGLLGGWAVTSNTGDAKIVRDVAARVFPENQGIEFYKHKSQYASGHGPMDDVPAYSKERIDAHILALKQDTENFYRAKFATKANPNPDLSLKTITAMRGVGGHVEAYTPGSAEPWTLDSRTPERFGKLMAPGGSGRKSDGPFSLLTTETNYKNVLWSWESIKGRYGWPEEKQLKGKREVVLIGGTVKQVNVRLRGTPSRSRYATRFAADGAPLRVIIPQTVADRVELDNLYEAGLLASSDSYPTKEQLDSLDEYVDLPEDAARVLRENLWDLYDDEPTVLGDKEGHEFHGNQWDGHSGTPGVLDEMIRREDERKIKMTAWVREQANLVAAKMHFDPKRIDVVNQPPRTFYIGGRQYDESGHYRPSTGQIQINASQLSTAPGMAESLIAHEITHDAFNEAFIKWGEDGASSKKNPPDDVKNFDAFVTSHADQLTKEDGVSDYSRAYWKNLDDHISPPSLDVGEWIQDKEGDVKDRGWVNQNTGEWREAPPSADRQKQPKFELEEGTPEYRLWAIAMNETFAEISARKEQHGVAAYSEMIDKGPPPALMAPGFTSTPQVKEHQAVSPLWLEAYDKLFKAYKAVNDEKTARYERLHPSVKK